MEDPAASPVVHAGLSEVLLQVQNKLMEHGFSVLDEVVVLRAQAGSSRATPGSPQEVVHAMQSLAEEALERVLEIIEQYGKRGQLVQELILSAETAARRNERLASDNKELALQITGLSQGVPTQASASASQQTDDGNGDVQQLQMALQNAQKREQDTAASAQNELARLQAQLVDATQDLAVSLKREAGLGAELKRLEKEQSNERKQFDARIEAMRRKELNVFSLVQDKEKQLELCQERLRVVIEDEERRREEARILLKTYPRRSSPVPGRPSISRRSATTGLSSGGGANGDMRTAALVATLLDDLQAQEAEMAAIRKDNGELNASLRQLLTRIPHADRMSIDLGSGGIGREDSKGLGRGVSVRSSNLSPSQVLPSRVLHTGGRRSTSKEVHSSKAASGRGEQPCGGGDEGIAGGQHVADSELALRYAAMVEEVQRVKRNMVEMSGAVREAEERMEGAIKRRDQLLEQVSLLQNEVQRLQRAESTSLSSEGMGIRRGATERQSEESAQQGTDHSSNIGEHGAGRLTEEQLKYANIGTNSSSSQDMGAGKPRVLSHVKHSVDVSLQACAAGADSDRVAGLALEKGLRNQLSAMLHVPEDQVLMAVRKMVRLGEQVTEVKARASEAALAIHILAKVEDALSARVDSAVTGREASQSWKKASRADPWFRESPHGVVEEVKELVSFEKRWLTDALVNSDTKCVYEVSFRAISKLQALVEASGPDETLATVSKRMEEAREHCSFYEQICALLQMQDRHESNGLQEGVNHRKRVLDRVADLMVNSISGITAPAWSGEEDKGGQSLTSGVHSTGKSDGSQRGGPVLLWEVDLSTSSDKNERRCEQESDTIGRETSQAEPDKKENEEQKMRGEDQARKLEVDENGKEQGESLPDNQRASIIDSSQTLPDARMDDLQSLPISDLEISEICSDHDEASHKEAEKDVTAKVLFIQTVESPDKKSQAVSLLDSGVNTCTSSRDTSAEGCGQFENPVASSLSGSNMSLGPTDTGGGIGRGMLSSFQSRMLVSSGSGVQKIKGHCAAPVAWELLLEDPNKKSSAELRKSHCEGMNAGGAVEVQDSQGDKGGAQMRGEASGDVQVKGARDVQSNELQNSAGSGNRLNISVLERVAMAREVLLNKKRLPVTKVSLEELEARKRKEKELEEQERDRVARGLLQTACRRHLQARARTSGEHSRTMALADSQRKRVSEGGDISRISANFASQCTTKRLQGAGQDPDARSKTPAPRIPALRMGPGEKIRGRDNGEEGQKRALKESVRGRGRHSEDLKAKPKAKGPKGLAPPIWGGRGEAPGSGTGGILSGWIGETQDAGSGGLSEIKLKEDGKWVFQGGRAMWMGAGSGDVHEEEVDENTSEEPGQARKGHETSTATAQQEPSAISELDYERALEIAQGLSGVVPVVDMKVENSAGVQRDDGDEMRGEVEDGAEGDGVWSAPTSSVANIDVPTCVTP